ncbi:hypothetical protein PVAG01_09850 [Phlyctema vagabunda]|uniref:AB hydrolase-1 domain-containing protein n=1 Tax=Phlyctema vagabunda TaxID=108571 RepID=A0ABR4P494_9HELO
MPAKTTIDIPHLLNGGVRAGYQFAQPYSPDKPTVVLVNAMCMTTDLYNVQFDCARLTDAMNLLAIEPLGHGSTTMLGPGEQHFTYWDSATLCLEVMRALGIWRAFALGTSQGGWIVARMALMAPDKVRIFWFLDVCRQQIQGIIPLGTSMDYESAASREDGCWDAAPVLIPWIEKWTSTTPTPDWVVEDEWCGMIGSIGFGASTTDETTTFWTSILKDVYSGDEGRKKVRMAAICLLDRDGLRIRIQDIKCPVRWLQGTEDLPFKTKRAQEEIKLFINSPDATLQLVEGGSHYLNASKPKAIEEALLELVGKYGHN